MSIKGFKNDFAWGASTASYQIEGAAYEGGKGLSVWDIFTKTPGKVFNNDNGDVACDHYHRLEEDLDLIKELGLNSYRFSLSWPRLIPDGSGELNQEGIDYYNKLIDGLIERGIRPFVTMFHWDYPYELYKKGGWMNSESSDWFAYYADQITKLFGDRVKHWFTINEPQIFIGMGHETGRHAPGHKHSREDLVCMVHNVLLSHGKAVSAVRKNVEGSKVGIAPAGFPAIPLTDSEKDIALAKKVMFCETEENILDNSAIPMTLNAVLWDDPIYLGKYPQFFLDRYEDILPKNWQDDMALISQKVDFMGVNLYQGMYVSDDHGEVKIKSLETGEKMTGFDWRITPEILYWGMKFYYERYNKPIYITENGLSLRDWVSVDGKVHDENRIDFLTRYLRQYKKAAQDGVELAGYFQWSLMDNFEWAEGYKERFGLIHVDYQTLKRTPKESYYWYKDLVASNGENL